MPYVRVDFDRWIDEDDEEKPSAAIPNMNDFGGADFGNFNPENFKMPEGYDDGECDDENCGDDCCHDGAECNAEP